MDIQTKKFKWRIVVLFSILLPLLFAICLSLVPFYYFNDAWLMMQETIRQSADIPGLENMTMTREQGGNGGVNDAVYAFPARLVLCFTMAIIPSVLLGIISAWLFAKTQSFWLILVPSIVMSAGIGAFIEFYLYREKVLSSDQYIGKSYAFSIIIATVLTALIVGLVAKCSVKSDKARQQLAQ